MAGVFQAHIVIVGEAIKAHHGMTIGEHTLRQVKADEAGRAGDEDACHR